MKSSTSKATTAWLGGIAAVLTLMGSVGRATAQTPNGDPLPKSAPTERQSQQNPAGRVHGGNTNRGRMSADFLWGVTNANRTFDILPGSRVPAADGFSTNITLDGFTFPYYVDPVTGRRRRVNPVTDGGTVSELLYPRVRVDNELAASVIVGQIWSGAISVTEPPTPAQTGGPVAGPSTSFIGSLYHRAPKQQRLATTLPDPPADPTVISPATDNKFVWYPSIPGAAQTVGRYAIRVHIPEPAPSGSVPEENRITDARYIVYYQMPDGQGGFYHRRKICTLAQDVAGDEYLRGSDGEIAYFPMFSSATYLTAGTYRDGVAFSDARYRARVELDNTSENTGENLWVVADQVEFIQRSTTIKSSPVVTPQHGGRDVDVNQVVSASAPYQQPTAGPDYNVNPYLETVSGFFGYLNDSFDFANNPRDPEYNPTDPLYNVKRFLDTSNPSVLFAGPASIVDPRGDPTVVPPAVPTPIVPTDPWNGSGQPSALIDAFNQMLYRRRLSDGTFVRAPLFSQLQVLVTHTELIPDPETDVPVAQRDGTKTIEVGYITAHDWLTGTVIWRWPDRSYLPALRSGLWRNPKDNSVVLASGSRNPIIGTNPRDTVAATNAINLIPGISALDRNGDGFYTDDEIFVVGQGSNPSGGFSSPLTIVPNIPVKGDVLIPLYRDLGNNAYRMESAGVAPIGRYVRRDAMNNLVPVPVTLAFVGGNNGVVYALDPYGNNDSQYTEQADTTRLGTFYPGTTNVLWTFSPTSAPRKTTTVGGTAVEQVNQYANRLKSEVPVPGPFGSSAPVVEWAKEETDATLDRTTEEPRLFIGNQNKNLYALDARAIATTDPTTAGSLPIRKGEQPVHPDTWTNSGIPELIVGPYRTDLKWWFETEGTVNTPAVSDLAFARNGGGKSKRVVVTTGEGRVYGFDWQGPVTRFNHELNMVWDGTSGIADPRTSFPNPPAVNSAAAFNDNYTFHNDRPALQNSQADRTEGMVRPVWAFPNRYIDIDAAAAGNRRGIDRTDRSSVYPANYLASPSRLNGFVAPPVLVSMPFREPDATGITGLTGVRNYVLASTNDVSSDTSLATQGHLYLLDMEGDRNDFLTNPMPTRAASFTTPSHPAVNSSSPSGATSKPSPLATATIYSQPLDQFVSKIGTFGPAAPVWMYRSIYDTYKADGTPDISKRNMPTGTGVDGLPARKTVPTVYVGGKGRLYAIDFDEKTGLFVRWRNPAVTGVTDLSDQPTPLDPDRFRNSSGVVVTPGPEAPADRLNPSDAVSNPYNPIFNLPSKLALRNQRVLARTIDLPSSELTDVTALVVTGGPLQNRNNATAEAAANALSAHPLSQSFPPVATPGQPTVPLVPTLDAPMAKELLTPEAAVNVGTLMVPLFYDLNPFGYDLSLTASLAGYPVTALFLPRFDFTGRFVNQDIDDPITTTLGSLPGGIDPTTLTTAQKENKAYQYPTLIVNTERSFMYQVSTNTEGLDPSIATRTDIPGAGTTDNLANLGWAVVDGDLFNYNTTHAYQFVIGGPGGLGSGIAVLTNAFFPSLDGRYARRPDLIGKQPSDTSKDFFYYPQNEPNATTTDYGDAPRPHFKARPLYAGNAADAAATPPINTVAADDHTGRTGFPLDANGLFYDKQFAYDATSASAIVNNNAKGRVRLPGYSKQGALAGSTITTGEPDTDFDRAKRVTDLRTAGVANVVYREETPTTTVNDVNAAGQNVTWIYSGGEDGLLYAFTPVFNADLGGNPNGDPGGIRDQGPNSFIGQTGEARVDIFDKADFDRLRATARAGGAAIRPTRDGTTAPGDPSTDYAALSRAANNKPNVFEWGETIYIIVWDVTVVPASSSAYTVSAADNVQVRLNIGGVERTLSLERSAGRITTYPYKSFYKMAPENVPAGLNPAQLGVAFYEFRLDESVGLPLTPGKVLAIRIAGQDNPVGQPAGRNLVPPVPAVGGAFTAQQLIRMTPQFAVANPLAVQGFVTDTRTGQPALPRAVGTQAGGIGPFLSPNATDSNGIKTRVATGATTPVQDPDRINFEYSQALANGNTVTRSDYDPYRRNSSGRPTGVSNTFLQRLKTTDGFDEPSFYIPVVAGAGYVGHGRTGSTDLSASQRTLRVLNRSQLSSLRRVRAEVINDLAWRWWPGRVPNADVADDNPRVVPAGMSVDGRINPLPWEVQPTETKPWKGDTSRDAMGTAASGANTSSDYPDIIASSAGRQGRQAVSLLIAGTDTIQGQATLANARLDTNPNPVNAVSPFMVSSAVGYNIYSATLSVRVPQYQPANLVATHALTSTYVGPNAEDGVEERPGDKGDLQLPRDPAQNYGQARELRRYNGTDFNGPSVLTPFGYTTRVRLWVDYGSKGRDNGKYDDDEPYRIVEVWTGVPIDMGLKSAESPIDLGALPAGFGIQNGLLGYTGGTPEQGFKPGPFSEGYKPYFKRFTIQNTGNVNLYNLRASQKVESLSSATLGSGTNYFLFGLQSDTVDPRYGILSAGADPRLSGDAFRPANQMGQVVTSLDPRFDAQWDALYQSLPWMNQSAFDGSGLTVYQRYYAGFAGRHTLGKAKPGASTPTTLGLPDLPTSSVLVPLNVPTQPTNTTPFVGVAVPVGTPAGVYRPAATQQGAPPQFAVFEDHDTDPTSGYVAIPGLTASIYSAPGNPGSVVIPAGPRYAGQNAIPPGTAKILPVDGSGNETTVLRARAVVPPAGVTPASVEYQPHTSPAVDLKVTVAETPITGLIPDFATSAFGLDGVFTGLLPGIDPLPIFEGNRPAASITPATFRGADGKIHLYFARNATPDGVAHTAAGDPMHLLHTYLNWDPVLGTFVASVPGVPLADPTANTGRWFTTSSGNATEEINPGSSGSNLYPSVLQTNLADLTAQSFLFWIESTPVSGGAPVDTLRYGPIDATTGNVTSRTLFSTPTDPSIRRYGPRASYDLTTNTGFVFYYGGAPGRWTIRYVPFGIRGTTLATGGGRRGNELNLTLPTSLVSTSEPVAIVRRLALPDHDPAASATVPNNPTMPVVDVFYTGVSRNDNTPDLFMTRYRFATATNPGGPDTIVTGVNARLIPVGLPAISNERLVQTGRELVWQARHIGWNRNFNPVITVNPNVPARRYATVPGNWLYDNNSQRYAQVIRRGTSVVYVYVDTEGGTVSFRGAGAPGSGDEVVATYQPTTYRLTPDSASDSGAFVTMDTRVLPAGTGIYSGIYRRPAGPLLSRETSDPVFGNNLSGVGRLWTIWQKGAQPNRPATLFFAARRVGIDLKSVTVTNPLGKNESILLGSKDGLGNQAASVSVLVNGVSVPFDLDHANSRVYVDPVYEGLQINVTYTATSGAPTTNRNATAVGRLGFIEELNATDTASMGLQAPLLRNINEGQVGAFLDLYNYDPTAANVYQQGTAGAGRAATNINALGDPTLMPGRLWMFWSTSRPRQGRIINTATGLLEALPSGFDLYYQTLAPRFETPSKSGLGN